MTEFANIDKYPFTIRPLSVEDGGGFLIEYPDLPGCHSDGDTPEQAIVNGRDALRSYLLSCRKHGDPYRSPARLFRRADNSGYGCPKVCTPDWWPKPKGKA